MNSNNIHIVFFSDTHLGYDFPIRPRVVKKRRGQDFFRNFESVLSYTINNQIDLIVHGGDLFFRHKVSEFIIDRVYQTLSDFAQYQIPFYIVPGNHERSELPPSLFLKHPNINIFNQVKFFSVFHHDFRIILAGFPFIRKNIRGKFPNLMEELEWYKEKADLKILIFHQAVEGATVGPENYRFRNSEDVIPLSLIPDDATAVLCGHIHRRQILTKGPNKISHLIPVIFSGSTERTSFAEKDEKKGFYHLIFNKSERNNCLLRESRFIELPSRPMEDIYIESGLPAQNLESYLMDKIKEIDQDSYIRLRSHKPITKDLAKQLTAVNLRKLLPTGMSFKFSSDFFAE